MHCNLNTYNCCGEPFCFLSAIGQSVTVYEVFEGGMLQVCLTITAAPGGPLGSALSIDVNDQSKFLRYTS